MRGEHKHRHEYHLPCPSRRIRLKSGQGGDWRSKRYTGKELGKELQTRAHERETGDEVEPWNKLREGEGDLLEMLGVNGCMPETVEMLLLDSDFMSLDPLSKLLLASRLIEM
jgi:hypothetical protein